MPNEELHEWRLVYGAIVLVVVAGLLYTLLPVLSPIVFFLALIALLSPWRGSRYYSVLLITLSALIVFWLLRTLGSLLAPFVLAFVIAYILDPVVDRLQARRIKRPLAVAMLALPLLALVVVVAVFGVPALIAQAQDVIAKIPDAAQKAVTWLETLGTRLSRIAFFSGTGLDRVLASFSPQRLTEFLQQRQAEILHRAWSGVLGLGKGVGLLLSIVGYVVLVPVLVIYLLNDFDPLVERALALLPIPMRARWEPLLQEYNQLLGRYFRGQLIEATFVGVLTWLGLFLLGFPYAGFVGVVAGVFNLVPYIGLLVSTIPALIIAVLSGDVAASLLKVAGVFGVVQFIDGSITGPRIVGGSIGLHPVWVILALSIGGFFFGFIGVLLALPAAVLAKLLLRDALVRYRTSTLYRGVTAPAP